MHAHPVAGFTGELGQQQPGRNRFGFAFDKEDGARMRRQPGLLQRLIERRPIELGACKPVVERMPLVAGAFAIHLPPPDLPGLLGLAALPMLRFERPRELNQLDVSARVLAERLADKRDD